MISFNKMFFYFSRDQFSKAQKRKSGILKSAASVMNELQRNIDGWEVGIPVQHVYINSDE